LVVATVARGKSDNGRQRFGRPVNDGMQKTMIEAEMGARRFRENLGRT
jgi:hypothetical protein